MNKKFTVYNEKTFRKSPLLMGLCPSTLHEIEVVGSILPFRVNNFVIEELINWNNVPEDPMYQLTFPQRKMISQNHFEEVSNFIKGPNFNEADLKNLVNNIRKELNPHPSDQLTLNIPYMGGTLLQGMQHKYKETVLSFPAQGQTCHSYCTFCFRWAQFVGVPEWKFSSNEPDALHKYLETHKEVTDLLLTGGDPLIANTRHLTNYLEPLLDSKFDHIQNIRIGTKSLTYWPYRFTEAPDADELLFLFEKLVKHGKHVAIMAHYNHGRELEPEVSRQAIKRVIQTGAVIRSQGPVLAHINDKAEIWATLWKSQVQLGIIPYYMFVERDTGASRYFKIPLEKCWEIYKEATKDISGLCKTVRGPCMSTSPGKIEIQGIVEIGNEKFFVLSFIQARDSDWNRKPFLAQYDPSATWFDQLKPLSHEKSFFFQQ